MTIDRVLKVLLVEDNPGDVLLVQEMLRSSGESRIEILSTNRISLVDEIIQKTPVDAVLLDLGLPDARGLETLRKLHSSYDSLPIVILTSQEDEQLAVTALQIGAQDFLVKGTVDSHLLTRAIFYAIKRKEMDFRLHHLAYHDALTELANRKLFHEQLSRSIEWNHRRGKKFAVIFLDLDNFKLVNDTYGHTAGDLLLKQVAQRLLHLVRKSDTVARMGGDEFAIIIDSLPSFDYVSHFARKIRETIGRSHTIDSNLIDVDFSIGISLYPLDGATEAELIRKADRAMYMAKESGANRFHFYNKEMDDHETKRHALRTEFAQALERKELSLHYQPIINLRTHDLVGAEALVRWNHPQRGLLLPGQFLPDIMGTDQIVHLGDWVFEEALSRLSLWGGEGISIPISVNVDLLQIKRSDFNQKLARLFERFADVSPHLLEMEILETTAAEGFSNLREVLDELHRMGVRFALDDFGTGYSSLAYLKHLPIDTLKIDQSFVIGMLDNRENLAIIESIASLARIFGRNVIAEGMEERGYSSMLMKLGCDLAQGFAISKPLPPDGFLEWQQEWIRKEHHRGMSPSSPVSELSILATQVHHLAWIQRIISLVRKSVDHPLTSEEESEFLTLPVEDWYQNEGLMLFGEIPTFRELEKTRLEAQEIARDLLSHIRGRNGSSIQFHSQLFLLRKDALLSLYGTLQKDALFRSLMEYKTPK
jgi:diguanylate cyclase (GGDEF)-like protein